jgi:hypothetical protein
MFKITVCSMESFQISLHASMLHFSLNLVHWGDGRISFLFKLFYLTERFIHKFKTVL